jgi:hypothetical protein
LVVASWGSIEGGLSAFAKPLKEFTMFDIKQTLKKTVLGAAAVATLGGATLAATTADAHPHGNAGAAIGAGILGLALGAAIASHHDYDRPYYAGYAYGPGYGYAQSCRSYWQWSPRWGRDVQVERCY